MKLLFKQRFFSWFDSYDVYDEYGERVFTVEGKLGWDYTVTGAHGECIATIEKELLHFTDTYSIDVADTDNALCVLMLVLAIDAEKCSSNNG